MKENESNLQRFNLNEEVKEDQHNETIHSDDNEKSLTLEWRGYNFKRFAILTFVFIFIFGVLIGIEFAYRNPLFDANSNTVSHFQWESTPFKNFMVVLAYFGEAEGVAATLFIFVPILSYSDAMVTLILMTSVLYLNCIMKVLYHSPRPFWVAGDIHAYQCGKEYGNPSGHAMYIPSVLPYILYLILKHLKLYSNLSSKVFLIVLIICTTLMVLLVTTILFGRIYLGVHSYNQVLYGALIGITMLCYLTIIFENFARIYISSFIWKKAALKRGLIHLFAFTVFTIFMVIVGVISYVINTSTFDDPSSWLNAIISKCGISSSSIYENSTFARKGFLTTLASTGSIGGIFGIIFFSIVSNKMCDHQNFFPIWKTLLRFLINVIICIPFGCLLLIPSSNSIVVLAIFANFLPMFACTFLVFGVNRIIFIKLSLLTTIPSEKIDANKINSKDHIEEQKEES